MGLIESNNQSTSVIALPADSENVAILEEKKIQWVRFPFSELRKNLKAALLYIPLLLLNARRVWNYCKRNQITMIHSNDHYNLVPIVIKFFVRQKTKLVVHVRLLPGTYNSRLYNLYRFLNNKYADKIIAVSNSVAKAYGHKKKITVIHDAYVMNEKYPPHSINLPQPFRFLYVGNYIRGKGQEHALKAFQIFQKKFPEAELHYYGSTMGLKKNEDFKLFLMNEAGQARSTSVFFHDFCEDTEKIYKSHHVSLMFSDCESFSMVSFESLFYGIPTIATDSGGPTDFIDNMQNGILVPIKNIDAMVNAMQCLYQNECLRSAFSKQGRMKIDMLISKKKDFFALAESL
jgi:glycosyltransferase involved in cell wall biosynthesis